MNPASADMKPLFEPRSVAVIGASHNPAKLGYKILQNVVAGGFPGPVYPINPKPGKILGNRAYPRIEDVGAEIDLATIVIPQPLVMDAVRGCAAAGVKLLSIITSGYSEVGNLAGERELVDYALDHGMRVLGPNIFGIYSAMPPLNATFGPPDIQVGGVAIISQSGALGAAMIGKTKSQGIGLSTIVSVGNKSDIDEADLLAYLIENDRTNVILMYIEGIKNGEKLVRALDEATHRKPIVVIKSGRSKRGAMAAASHTGSLAGADEVFSDVARQVGVHRAESIQEALNWCNYLSRTPLPRGENTVIITNGGGIGVLAADACEKYGVSLYDNLGVMKQAFSGAVPEFGSVKNPVDLTGQAAVTDYQSALEAAYARDDIHALIVMGCETAILTPDRLPEAIDGAFQRHRDRKPAVFSFFGGTALDDTIDQLRQSGMPIYGDVYEAISCLGVHFRDYRHLRRERPSGPTVTTADPGDIDVAAIDAIMARVRADNRTFLLAQEGQALMVAAGLPMPKSLIARSLEEAVAHATTIGYPVVLKVVSRDILHKSDAGGVALDLLNADEVVDAYQAILHNCRVYRPTAKITGVEVGQMVKRGTETIIGARRDASLGPVIMFGLGGIYVEVMKDIAFRSLPIDNHDALAMMEDIRSYPLLLGVRGEERKDIEAAVDALIKVGRVLQHCEAVSDIEINPLVVYDQGEGVVAVDVRVLHTRTEDK
jgi:acetate---CoA ligase (ADP-forming)